MDLSKISHPQAKQAIEALQANELADWYACFSADPVFTDDGRTLGFRAFFDNAFAHNERFLTIEHVKKGGLEIDGDFFAGQWGTFRVFMRFHEGKDGKFDRLDIGQVR